jgi:hypothetical protein
MRPTVRAHPSVTPLYEKLLIKGNAGVVKPKMATRSARPMVRALEQKTYRWGDALLPGGLHRCSIWQGDFPDLDLAEDGFSRPAPGRTFRPNGFGLYNTLGNVSTPK